MYYVAFFMVSVYNWINKKKKKSISALQTQFNAGHGWAGKCEYYMLNNGEMSSKSTAAEAIKPFNISASVTNKTVLLAVYVDKY